VSLPWKTVSGEPAASNGIVGVSDGFTDLANDRTMDWRYPAASSGNVAQMGWIDLGTSPSGSADFSVALGFGGNEAAAMAEAAGALDHADTAQATYIAQWKAYTAGLADLGGTADNQFRLAAMVIKSAQDKTNGAMVAGLGTPWGETNTDTNAGGYHLVWPRDLFKFASAMINAGDSATANRAVEYLFNIQMDQTTGRFPQNTFDSGKPYWNGLQMDETAMPIVLAWRLGRNDLWPKVKLAADFVLRTGPRTDQERWEEVSGYSPSTIAAEVAGLVAAAELAQANGDTDRAKHYRAKADEWRNNVANWTFTQAGPLGNKRYYIRISNSLYADRDDKIHLQNGAPEIDQKQIVDGGFLELVRFGLMSPDDWTIRETLPEYDGLLRQSLPGRGFAWFRYNYDGYGERNDGSNYEKTGRGRLWPIFTAERGIYEVLQRNDGSAGKAYKDALKAFSSPSGFIPEQVWNQTTKLLDWQVDTPAPHVPGTPTKSIAPLNWAMGEYINLLHAMWKPSASRPEVVCQRYSCDKPMTTVTFNVEAQTVWGEEIYLVGDNALLGEWTPSSGIRMAAPSYPTWTVTTSLPANTPFSYKFLKRKDGQEIWEGGSNRSFSTPTSGEVTKAGTWQP